MDMDRIGALTAGEKRVLRRVNLKNRAPLDYERGSLFLAGEHENRTHLNSRTATAALKAGTGTSSVTSPLLLLLTHEHEVAAVMPEFWMMRNSGVCSACRRQAP